MTVLFGGDPGRAPGRVTLSPADLNQAHELAHHWRQTLAVTTAGDTAIRNAPPLPARRTAAGMVVSHTGALLASARTLAALDRLVQANPRAELSAAVDAATRAAADPSPTHGIDVWALVDAHRQGA